MFTIANITQSFKDLKFYLKQLKIMKNLEVCLIGTTNRLDWWLSIEGQTRGNN